MHLFIIGLLTAFSTVLVPFVIRLLKGLGIGIVTYTGIDLVLTELVEFAQDALNGLPADILSFVGMMNLDIALNMIVSAILAKTVLDGFNSATGTKKDFVLKA